MPLAVRIHAVRTWESRPATVHLAEQPVDIHRGIRIQTIAISMTPMILLTCAALTLALLYAGRAFLAWAVPVGVALASWALPEGITTLEGVALGIYAAALLALGAPFVRRMLISGKVLKLLKPIFPSMSDTERTALELSLIHI